MYEKVDPGHQPATATEEQPKAMACSCSCGCRCNCATSDQATSNAERHPGSFEISSAQEAVVPT